MTTAATQALPDKSVPVGTIQQPPPAPAPTPAAAAPAAAAAASAPAPAAAAPPAPAKPAEPAPAKPAEPAAAPEAEKSPWDAEPAPAAAAVPTKIELKAPEGMTVEPAVLQEISKRATDLGLTQQQAEKYLAQSLSDQKAATAATQKQIRDTDQAWLGQLRKEWGNDFTLKSENVKRGLKDLDPTGEFQKVVKAAGLVNAPTLVRMLERHGSRMAEDKLGVQTAGKTDGNQKKTPQQRITEEKQALLDAHPPALKMGQRK